jgi:hypothetical protein
VQSRLTALADLIQIQLQRKQAWGANKEHLLNMSPRLRSIQAGSQDGQMGSGADHQGFEVLPIAIGDHTGYQFMSLLGQHSKLRKSSG